jgi:hypothetical protein
MNKDDQNAENEDLANEPLDQPQGHEASQKTSQRLVQVALCESKQRKLDVADTTQVEVFACVSELHVWITC